MLVVGLTGLMGSGKSTVLSMFQELGADIYNADIQAKNLMNSPELAENIIELFGAASYVNGKLNRSYIAGIVFNKSVKLQELNALVHPVVQKDFERFVGESAKDYVVYESALLFQSTTKFEFDRIIIVTAPEELRFERILERDSTNKDEIKKRLKHQQVSEIDLKNADFVIENLTLKATSLHVKSIHKALLSEINN